MSPYCFLCSPFATLMQDLKITIIQADLHWEDIGANLAMFEEKIWQIGESTDVIVLPEMFTTGFTMQAPRLAEHMNMRTFKWMKQMADQTGALILGSFIANVHDRFYNRLLWMEPGGNYKTYDKRHLFRMADEHQVYTPGESLLIGHWKGWRICPLICYDLRFPVWSRRRWFRGATGGKRRRPSRQTARGSPPGHRSASGRHWRA